MYNIVLIGCGYMGAVHLDDIYLRENVNIYGVVDLDINKAKLFAKKYGANSYDTDYMRYILDERTDIVICATYSSSHLEIVRKCIKFKKHCLCEKPIVADVEEAEEFVSLVKSAETKVLIGYILRHSPTYKKVADMIHSGMIGSPLVIRMAHNQHVMNWNKYINILKDSSPIVDCGVHYIDVCRWFTGAEITDINGISAVTDKHCPKGQYNYGLITMELSDGSVAYYEAGWDSAIAAFNSMEFIGPEGSIKIVERVHRFTAHEEGDLIEFYDKKTKEYRIINIDCVRRSTGDQLQHLIKMIEDDIPAVPTIDDAYISFKIAMEVDASLKNR